MINTPRGIRNNNSGNIRYDGTKWLGLAMPPDDDDGFCVFTVATYGLRAIFKILLQYHRAYKLDTVLGIINRWAPPTENNTGAYQMDVANRLGINVTDHLDLTSDDVMCGLCAALVLHENGDPPIGMPKAWYEISIYQTALHMALGGS